MLLLRAIARCFLFVLAFTSVAPLASVAHGQTFSILHLFSDSGLPYDQTADGKCPRAGLTLGDSTLYGTTYMGCGVPGYTDFGTVFKIDTDGTGYSILHSFDVSPGDGLYPICTPVLDHSTVYGTSRVGGVFRVNTDGSDYAVLHSFGSSDSPGGADAVGSLTLGGSTLYGTTLGGGSYGNYGTVFKINTDGTGFATLYSFNGTDGQSPVGDLVLSDSTLYGVVGTAIGPHYIFKINTDGSGCALLHMTGGGTSAGGLVLSGSTLYGAAYTGGKLGGGSIFKIGTDGGGYEVLHSFRWPSSSYPDEEAYPNGGLILSGSTLYGTTKGSGYDHAKSVVFKINTDGTGYSLLYNAGSAGLNGHLALAGSTLYGTAEGGNYVFALTIPEPSTLAMLSTGLAGLLVMAWRRRRSGLREELTRTRARCFLFVLAFTSVAPLASVAHGQTFSILHTFGGSGTPPNWIPDGTSPCAGLTLGGSTLYGTTNWGWGVPGDRGWGTIFRIDTDGSDYGIMHSFGVDWPDGMNSICTPILDHSTLYGTARFDCVFRINTDGSDYTVLHTFGDSSNPEGCDLIGSLALGGSTLYGTTRGGGSYGNYGTVFKLDTDGAGFATLHSFNDTDARYPLGDLVLGDSTLYGVVGSASGGGYIFKINTDGSEFAILHSLGGSEGGRGGLILDGSTLYGAILSGGRRGGGTIFKIGTDGGGYEVLHSFRWPSSSYPDEEAYPNGGLILSGSTLYGTTKGSGYDHARSVVFKINTDGTGYSLLYNAGSDALNGHLALAGSTLYGTAEGGNYVFALTIPEPSSLAMLSTGLASLLVMAWRRRKRAQ